MYDAGKILPGLALFLVALTFPFWYSIATGKAASRPELVLPAVEKKCVEPRAFMRDSHMVLLNQWRDSVVREGNRYYVAADGSHHEMSLSLTCMSAKCHSSREKFCDRCHNYVSQSAFCWDCHVAPAEE